MLNRRNLLAGAAAGLGAGLLSTFEAFAATWVVLGTRTVDLFGDNDTVRVGAGAGLFNRIRMSVTGNTVFVNNLRVVFSNGTSHDVALRFMFLPGSSSREILLPGALRRIRRVEFTYRRLPGGGRATVTLEGFRI